MKNTGALVGAWVWTLMNHGVISHIHMAITTIIVIPTIHGQQFII
jgi:hypothetical protein